MTEQLTVTLNVANAPPTAESDSQALANQSLPVVSNSSPTSTHLLSASSSSQQKPLAATGDLLSGIIGALDSIGLGGPDSPINLGDLSLAGVLSINNVQLSFSDLAIASGKVVSGTVTIQTGTASLTLGGAVTSNIDSITGSYDIGSKTFSLTLGSGDEGAISLAFASYVNITAASANLTYVAAGSTEVTLSDSSSESVSLLTIGISSATIFAGLNGPSSNPDAVGVELSDATVGLALLSTGDGMVYYGVSANATALQGIGLPDDIQVGVGELNVEINGASDGGETVVNFDASFTNPDGNGLAVSGTSLVLDYDQFLIHVAGSLSLSVTDYIEISGGFGFTKTADAIQIDVGTTAFDGAEALSFSLGGFFSASGNLSMVIDADHVTINEASLTVNEKFTLGPILEVDSPGVGVSNIVIDRLTGSVSGSEAGNPTIEIMAGSARLFPGNTSISASATATESGGIGLDAKFDLITGAFSIHVEEFELVVGTVLTAHASDSTISYNPEDSDPHQQLVHITEGTIEFNKFNITGSLTGLTIFADGFAFESITVTYNDSIKFGTILTLNQPAVTLTDFAVTFSDGNASVTQTGSLTVSVASGSMKVAAINVDVKDLAITVGLDPATNLGDTTITAGSLNLAFSTYVTVRATDITINTNPAEGDPYFEVHTATATLTFKSVVLSGTASNFSVINSDVDGTPAFEAGQDFSVGFSASAADLNLPTWIKFSVQKFLIQWPDFNLNPSNFKLVLSASIDGIDGLPGGVEVSGEISDAVIDIGKLQEGQFPITSIGSLGGGVSGKLFGMEVNAGFIMGIVSFNKVGDIVDGSGDVYHLTTNAKGKVIQTQVTENPDTEVVDSVLYVGVEGGAFIPGVGGVQIYIGFSSLGPLTLFMSANFPLILEPTTGIALAGFSGGITFNYEIPKPTKPEDLATVNLSPDDMTVVEWQQQLRNQTVFQYNATSGGTDLFAAYLQPFVITASVSLYDAYASMSSFVITGTIGIAIKPLEPNDINIFLKGTATVGGTLNFDASLYLNLEVNGAATTATMMFLAQVPSEYTFESFGGSFKVGFTDPDGNAITIPTTVTTTYSQWIALTAAYDSKGAALITNLPVGTYVWTPGANDVSLTVDGKTYLAADGQVTIVTTSVSEVKLAGAADKAVEGTLASVVPPGNGLPEGAKYLVTTFAPPQELGGFYIQLTGFLKYQVPLIPELNLSINGSILLTVTASRMKLDVWGNLNVSFLGDIAVARGEFVLDYADLIDVGLPIDVPKFYGALMIKTGAGLAALEQYGLTIDGAMLLQINLTGADQVVNLPNAPPTAEPTGDETPLNANTSTAFTIAHEAFFDLTVLGTDPVNDPYATMSYQIADVTLFEIKGYLDLRLAYDSTNGVGLQMFAEIHSFNIGSSSASPGDALLTFSGYGMFVIDSRGFAAGINLTLVANKIPGLSLTGNYTLMINTTSQDVTFAIPPPPGTLPGNQNVPKVIVYDENGGVVGEATTIVIPAGPPVGLASLNGDTASFTVSGAAMPYFVIYGNGSLNILNALVLQGSFRIDLHYNATDGLVLSMLVDMKADLSAVAGAGGAGIGSGNVAVTGALQIVSSGDYQGVAALLVVGGGTTTTSDYGDFRGGAGMQLTANFQLAINTTKKSISNIGGMALKDSNGNAITLDPESMMMLGSGLLQILIGPAQFTITGSIFAAANNGGFNIAVNGVISAVVSNVTLLTMNAAGELIVDANGKIAGDLALSVSANNPLSGTGFSFSGSFDLRVNTTGTSISVTNPAGGAAIVLTAGPNGGTTGAVYAEIRASGTMYFGSASNGFQIQNTFFYLSFSNAGLAVSASGNLAVVIGGAKLFSISGSAAMLITAQGLAASLTVTVSSGAAVAGSNGYYAFSGTFTFQVNTTGQDAVIPNGPTISGSPGYPGATPGSYVQLKIQGTMALGGTSTASSSGLFLSGSFYLTAGSSGLAITAESTLNLKVGGTTFFTLTANGALLIKSTGIAAQINLTSATKLPGGFSFSGSLLLKVNTTGNAITSINGVAVSLPGVDAFGNSAYFDLTGTGVLTVLSIVDLRAQFSFSVGNTGVNVWVNGSLEVLGTIFFVNANAQLFSGGGFAMTASLSLYGGGKTTTFGNGFVTVSATFNLGIDTRTSYFNLGASGVKVYVLGLELTGGFNIVISGGKFSITADLKWTLFGLLSSDNAITIHFSLSNSGFTFSGGVSFHIGSDSTYAGADLNLSISSTGGSPSFSLSGSAALVVATVDIGRVGAYVSLSGSSAYLVVTYSLFGKRHQISFYIGSLANAPAVPTVELGYVSGGVLYLKSPQSVGYYEITVNSDRSVTIYQPGISGQTRTYTGANSINLILQNYTDSTVLLSDAGPNLPVTISSGGGTNQYTLSGGVATVTGSTGDDTIFGGTGNVTFNAGSGNSTFIGGGIGSTHNVINDPGSVTVIQTGFTSYSLVGTSATTAVLTYGGNTDTLNGPDIIVNLEAPGSGATTFAVTDYFGAATLNANGNTAVTTSISVTSASLTVTGNAVVASNGVTGTITLQNNDGTTDHAYGGLNLSGGAGDNTFAINNWGGGVLTMDGHDGNDNYVLNFQTAANLVATVSDSGLTGVDALIVNGTTGNDAIKMAAGSVTLGAQSVSHSGIESVTLYTKAGDDTVNVLDATVPTTINGASGANIYNVLATHAAMTINGGGGNNFFFVFSNGASLVLNGQGGINVFHVMASVLTGTQSYRNNAAVTIDGGASSTAALYVYGTELDDAVTIAGNSFNNVGLDLVFTGLASWSIAGLGGSDSFYVQSIGLTTTLMGEGSLPAWMLSAGLSAPDLTGGNTASTFDDTFRVGWRGAGNPGSLGLIIRPLTIVAGIGTDVVHVDNSSDSAGSNYALTPGVLTCSLMGSGGRIVYDSSLESFNIVMGSGDDALTINDMIATTVTTIEGALGNNDAVMSFSGDFAAIDLTLLNFQTNSLNVVGNFTGLLNDLGAFSVVTIGGSLSASGRFYAGAIDTGSIGGDLAGLLQVNGLLNTLAIGGGSSGKIIAGSINYISVQSAFGNKVFQVIEGGIERQIQASPVGGGEMSGLVRYAFFYDSSAVGDPQLTLRIINNGSVTPRAFNLLLTVLNASAQFNLGLAYAAAATGLSNLSVVGDILVTPSQRGMSFLGLTGAARTGVVLPFDFITGVEVSGILPIGRVQVAGIQGIAFGRIETLKGQLVNIFGDLSAAGSNPKPLWNLLGSTPVLMAATDTFVVPFTAAHSVQVYAQCNSNANVERVMTLTAQSGGTGPVVATVVIAPNSKQPSVQSIRFAGDGASVDSRYGVGNITSTGSIGDVTVRGKDGLGNLTASGIFGSINVTTGAVTGTIETTGIRIDPNTGLQTSVSADIGGFTYNSKGQIAGVTLITAAKGFTGSRPIICRGDLVSSVNFKGVFNGLLAVQGNVGAILTNTDGTATLNQTGALTRYGGLSFSRMAGGQIIVLGNAFGNITISGSMGGRLVVKGAAVSGLDSARTGILGNVNIPFGIASAGAVISGGLIGDVAGATKLSSGRIYGFLAAEGAIRIANAKVVSPLQVFADSRLNANGPVLDAIFTDQGLPLRFDTGGLLAGLALMQLDASALAIAGGQLTGTQP